LKEPPPWHVYGAAAMVIVLLWLLVPDLFALWFLLAGLWLAAFVVRLTENGR
jgi:hypothetical protein